MSHSRLLADLKRYLTPPCSLYSELIRQLAKAVKQFRHECNRNPRMIEIPVRMTTDSEVYFARLCQSSDTDGQHSVCNTSLQVRRASLWRRNMQDTSRWMYEVNDQDSTVVVLGKTKGDLHNTSYCNEVYRVLPTNVGSEVYPSVRIHQHLTSQISELHLESAQCEISYCPPSPVYAAQL